MRSSLEIPNLTARKTWRLDKTIECLQKRETGTYAKCF